jgi:hypothetical protein
MDYKTALEKLEALLHLIERQKGGSYSPEEFRELCMLYGECEETIHRFAGISRVIVPSFEAKSAEYPNFIEAGHLSGRTTIHAHEGYAQLLKVIGRVRQAAEDPSGLPAPPSISNLVQTRRRFRECCQFIQAPPINERGVQDILWIMLRSQYERVDREDTLPRFGAKGYKPDFGIPDLQTLVEVKFIGQKTDPSAIQEEILADVPGYLNDATGFTGIIELIYDHAQKLRDQRKFVEDL